MIAWGIINSKDRLFNLRTCNICYGEFLSMCFVFSMVTNAFGKNYARMYCNYLNICLVY